MSKRKPILRPLALAAVLAAGFAVVFAIIVGWLYSVWISPYGKSFVWEYAVVRDDGEPIVHRYDSGRGYRYRTFDGAELPETPDIAKGAALVIPGERELWEFPLAAANRVETFGTGQPFESWYFLHDGQRNGGGYFVAFDQHSKRRIGFIGRDGFRAERPQRDDWFPVDGLMFSRHRFIPGAETNSGHLWSVQNELLLPDSIYLISAGRLLRVDLRHRSVATLIDSADLIALDTVIPVGQAKAARESANSANKHLNLAVRTPDRVLILDKTGNQLGSFIIPADLRGESFVLYELSNSTALLFSQRSEFVWIDTAGSVLRRKKVVLESTLSEVEPWLVSADVPAPIFTAGAVAVVPLINPGEAPDYAAALRRSLAEFWPSLLAVVVLAAVMAWLCYRRQRRYAQPWTGVWVAFVFLTGLPGLVGYLFHRRWPVREACPACGRTVPRDRDACAACGVEFPPPKPKGIEVFA